MQRNDTAQKFNPRQHMVRRSIEINHYRDSYLNEVALHHHDFYELYYFLNGNVNYIIEGRTYRLAPGDLMLISPLELHQPLIMPEKKSYERIVLWLDRQFMEQLSAADSGATRCFDVTSPTHTNLLRLNAAQRQRMGELLERLLNEDRTEGFGKDLMMYGLVMELLVEVNRISQSAAANLQTESRSAPLVADVLDYINEHYHEPLTLDHLANLFYVSKFHLLHEFKEYVGTSVYRYIKQRRLLIARQMLSNGISPSNVYSKCGFSDYANFYRAFKTQYGVSPKEYLLGRGEGRGGDPV